MPPRATRAPGDLARRALVRRLLTPGRTIPLGFLLAIVVGTLVLLTPWVVADGAAAEGGTRLVVAAFTATSAVCVTGLVLVDTGSYWSSAGEGFVLALIHVGGLGIATLMTLLALLVTRRMGLQSRLTTGAATRTSSLEEARSVLIGITRTTLVVEAGVALTLTLRFALAYDEPWARATWLGVFHSVSAFNNAGFGLFEDSLMSFATDEWVTVPVMVAVVLGGLGFPVVLEVLRRTRLPWTVNTRLVLLGTALLLVGGTALYAVLEWDNAATLAGVDGPDRFWLALFMSVTARTAGFNTVDYGELQDSSLFLTCLLMFVGGGTAGTAGGIKVGTLAVLVAAVLAEVRGNADADVFGRRIAPAVIRQALAVIGLSLVVVGSATVVLLHLSQERLADVLFEVVSATATVGLSTGITAELPPGGDWVLVVCMYVGRLGPVTAAAALALRQRARLYRLPEVHPLVG